jgi:hypothetical protein
MPASAIYRDETLALRLERDELLARRHLAWAHAAAAAQLIPRRQARIAAGMTLAVAGATLLWSPDIAWLAGADMLDTSTPLLLIAAIPGAWLLAALVGLIVYAASGHRLLRDYAAFAVSDDAAADLQRLMRLPAPESLVEHAAALERRSVAWPLTGLALATPMLLHFCASPFFGGPNGFLGWLALSGVIAGPAHLALVWCSRRYARRIGWVPLDRLRGSGLAALGITTLVSAVPFAALFLIPPLIVFLTGLVFVPVSFAGFARLVESERHALRSSRPLAVPTPPAAFTH